MQLSTACQGLQRGTHDWRHHRPTSASTLQARLHAAVAAGTRAEQQLGRVLSDWRASVGQMAATQVTDLTNLNSAQLQVLPPLAAA